MRCSARLALLLSSTAVIYSVGCTLVTARTVGQCNSDSDCRARGPAFASTRCASDGTCELVTLPEASVVAADASTISCTTNLECNVALGNKARCVANECVSLTNGSCTIVDGDPTDPNAVFVGVMTPRTGVNAGFGINQYGVVRTAASEWNSSIAGQANTHSIVTIGCDELADPVGTTRFLSTTLQTTLIYGPIYDADFEQAVPIVNLNGTILLGPRVDDPALSTLGGAGKTIWSFNPNRSIQLAYFQNLMNILEPSVKSTFSISGDMKVAMVVASDPSSTDFANALEKTLTFNSKSVAANGANYQRINQSSFSFTTANDYSGTLTALLTAAPDFVIVAQEYDLITLVRAVNSGWTGTKFPRFLFLTEDGTVDSDVQLPAERFQGKLDFVTWQTSAQEITNTTAFDVAFRSAQGVDPDSNSASLYDAFYEGTYALQAVDDQNGDKPYEVDPGAFAKAIGSFNGPGTVINVGLGSGSPNNIVQMLGAISTGATVDLDGASGPLNFGTGGSPIQDAALSCVVGSGSGGTIKASGVTFSGSTGVATGTYSCL